MEHSSTPSSDTQKGVAHLSTTRKSSLRGLTVVAVLLGFGLSGTFLMADMSSNAIEGQVKEFIADVETESGVNIDYASLETRSGDIELGDSLPIKAPLTELVFKDVSLSESEADSDPTVTISQVVLGAPFGETLMVKHKLPETAHLDIKGLAIKNTEILDDLETQTGVDYQERLIDLSAGYQYSDEAETLELSLGHGVTDMNQLDINAQFFGMGEFWTHAQKAYRQEMAGATPSKELMDSLLTGLGNGQLAGLDITYQNRGEVEESFAKMAAESNMEVAELKQQLNLTVDQLIENKDIAASLKAFIAKPGTLTISLAPEAPIAVLQLPGLVMGGLMGQQAAALELMNVTVTAK